MYLTPVFFKKNYSKNIFQNQSYMKLEMVT